MCMCRGWYDQRIAFLVFCIQHHDEGYIDDVLLSRPMVGKSYISWSVAGCHLGPFQKFLPLIVRALKRDIQTRKVRACCLACCAAQGGIVKCHMCYTEKGPEAWHCHARPNPRRPFRHSPAFPLPYAFTSEIPHGWMLSTVCVARKPLCWGLPGPLLPSLLRLRCRPCHSELSVLCTIHPSCVPCKPLGCVLRVACAAYRLWPAVLRPRLCWHTFACLSGPPSMRGCSACGLGPILPRSACLRLVLFCPCPPLCKGVLWPAPAYVWRNVRSVFLFFFFGS